jgi:hypothetical protein
LSVASALSIMLEIGDVPCRALVALRDGYAAGLSTFDDGMVELAEMVASPDILIEEFAKAQRYDLVSEDIEASARMNVFAKVRTLGALREFVAHPLPEYVLSSDEPEARLPAAETSKSVTMKPAKTGGSAAYQARSVMSWPQPGQTTHSRPSGPPEMSLPL